MVKKKSLSVLIWVARIWGAIAFVNLLFFIIHTIDALNSNIQIFNDYSTKKWVSFICLPIGVMVALLIAQFRYRIGGLLVVLFIVGKILSGHFMMLDPIIYGIPGILFLTYSYLGSIK